MLSTNMVTVESLFYNLNIAPNSANASPQSRHIVTQNNIIPSRPLEFWIYSGIDCMYVCIRGGP
jgi:hypothetical protein